METIQNGGTPVPSERSGVGGAVAGVASRRLRADIADRVRRNLASGGTGGGEPGAGRGESGSQGGRDSGGDTGAGPENGTPSIDGGPTEAIAIPHGAGIAGEQQYSGGGASGGASGTAGASPAAVERGSTSGGGSSSGGTARAGTGANSRARSTSFAPVDPLLDRGESLGLPEPVSPGSAVSAVSVANPGASGRSGATGRSASQAAPKSAPVASTGKAGKASVAPASSSDFSALLGSSGPSVVPDIDGMFGYLLLSGRDALALSRGEHWRAITEEGIAPVAANLAEAFRRAFPDFARQAEKHSPLVVGLGGLMLLVAPILAYERYMIDNAGKMAGEKSPNPSE